jgi:hypothetical protein
MNMNKWVLSLTVGSLLFWGICYVQPGYAQHSNHACQREVRTHIERARRVVQHGVDSGQINRREAEGIRRNIQMVERDYRRAESDGHLSERECERLNRDVDRLYRHIKHDLRD